jgi:hypothetical protein
MKAVNILKNFACRGVSRTSATCYPECRNEQDPPPPYTHCFISVDGMDCSVNEPWPFLEEMYSEKFNAPGLKYEVAVCIKTGHTVRLDQWSIHCKYQ